MKKLLTLSAILVCCGSMLAQAPLERMKSDVYYLTDDSLLGRKAGSAQARQAAGYIEQRFANLGLEPFAAVDSYRQTFRKDGGEYCNVLAVARGSDPDLKGEYIILGAHYDHIGFKVNIAGDTIIYNGADDNASGTAMLLELARRVSERRGELRRTVVFAAFDAEELGLYGSDYMARTAPNDGRIKVMLNMDMVGWLRAGKALTAAGTGMLRDGQSVISDVSIPDGLSLDIKKFDKSIMTGSDHDSFAQQGIPAISFTTGIKSPYHKPADTAEKIDYEGMALIADYMESLVMELAGGGDIISSDKRAQKHGGVQVFEGGITAALGSNSHYYRDGAMRSLTGFAWNAGIYMQFNTRFVALRPQVLFEQRAAAWPGNGPDGWSSAREKFRMQSLVVPVDLMLKTMSDGGYYFYLFGGGYYSRAVGCSVSGWDLELGRNINRDEWGWRWGIGMNMSGMSMEFTSQYGLTDILKSAPSVRNRTFMFTMSYKLW